MKIGWADIHTGLIIGHAGLLSSRVIVKGRYGVCILFWGSGDYNDKPIT